MVDLEFYLDGHDISIVFRIIDYLYTSNYL